MATRKPRLLDLFCGAGGAAMGYARAGFEVVGVDIEPQPYYPFEFHQGDALGWAAQVDPEWINAIHASPPCQGYSEGARRYPEQMASYPKLIAPIRELLEATGLPWVIENVMGALPHMRNPLMLHGGMFGLGVVRRRLFESNVLLLAYQAPKALDPVGVYGDRPDGRILNSRYPKIRAARGLAQAQEAMGMPWADWHGVKEAIPPAYTEFIGSQLLAHLEVAV